MSAKAAATAARATTAKAAAARTARAAAATETATAAATETATPAAPARRARKTRAREDAAPDGVLDRHRDEWLRLRRLMDAALESGDYDLARTVKLLAETLRLRQDGERRAWGLDGKSETGRGGEALEIRWLS